MLAGEPGVLGTAALRQKRHCTRDAAKLFAIGDGEPQKSLGKRRSVIVYRLSYMSLLLNRAFKHEDWKRSR